MYESKHSQKVFLSYSRRDLAFVEQLASDLEEEGLNVWYDLSGLEGGARWRIEIEKAIRECQYAIVVLSPDSVASEWVEEERLLANELQKKIIPLYYRQCDLPLGYRTRHYIDVQGRNYERNYQDILRALDIVQDEKRKPSFSENGYSIPSQPEEKRKELPKFGLKKLTRIQKRIAILFGAGAILIVGILCSPLIKNWVTDSLNHIAGIGLTALPTNTSSPEPTVFLSPTVVSYPTEIIKTDPSDSNVIPMRLVPAGEFTMGDDEGESNEKPAHQVYLDAFFMDKYEVTNAQYKACVDAGVCDPPKQVDSYTRSSYYGNPEFSNYPVLYVNWEMASIYCEWRGDNLPSEAQWEKAARGIDSRTYPWGEEIGCKKANYNPPGAGFCVGDTTEVGSYEEGISPYGLYDMAGNVWEWVADWYFETYYQISPVSNPLGAEVGFYRVLRGGAWSDDESLLRTSLRKNQSTSGSSNRYFGFRCARNLHPEGSP